DRSRRLVEPNLTESDRQKGDAAPGSGAAAIGNELDEAVETAVECRWIDAVPLGREQDPFLGSQRDANATIGQRLDAFGTSERRPEVESLGKRKAILPRRIEHRDRFA